MYHFSESEHAVIASSHSVQTSKGTLDPVTHRKLAIALIGLASNSYGKTTILTGFS